MSLFAVGLPGQTPRLLLTGRGIERVEIHLIDGEVALPVDGPGEWLIAADGQSISAVLPSVERQWMDVRRRRDQLLSECDWTQLPDVAESTRAAWAPYRQALRDLTEAASPPDVVWPTMPGAGEPA